MIFNTTLFDEISFGLKQQGIVKEKIELTVDGYLKEFDLFELRNKNPFKLSDGQKQLLVISAVLAMQNKFIILDEPTTGIDKVNKKRLVNLLNKINSEGTGIILISHDNHLINDLNCREIFMCKGEVCEGGRRKGE